MFAVNSDDSFEESMKWKKWFESFKMFFFLILSINVNYCFDNTEICCCFKNDSLFYLFKIKLHLQLQLQV